jgi:hypothetical protein
MAKGQSGHRGGRNPQEKSRKMKGGRGLSPGKRMKIDARKARVAELDRNPTRVVHVDG